MNNEIISKIQKLLRLGQSENEHEAALAASAAQKLMDKYSISTAMLEMKKGKIEEEEVRSWEDPLYAGGKNRSQWRGSLASVIANANSCKIYTKLADIQIIGAASDVQTVRYLFAYCEREIERLSKKYAGNGKSWLNNYKIGAVSAIKDALAKAKTEARNELMMEYGSSAGSAIAIVDKKKDSVELWANKNLKLQMKGFGAQRLHKDARQIGYQDGQKINLQSGKGIGPGNKKLK